MKPKPPCTTVLPWLKANLGPHCLAPLTGTDTRALFAAVQIIELYSIQPNDTILGAFRSVVLQMQDSTKHLAFHAIAHVMDWGHRGELWERAGLPKPHNLPQCEYGSLA